MAPLHLALAGFANMFSVGTVYALSALQIQLPRLLSIPESWSIAPFGVACLGLSIGVATCATMVARYGANCTTATGTFIWGFALIQTGYFLSIFNFNLMLLSFLVGGLGVGWAYLAVVVMIGQGFPNYALARSAIGPLGFSSGAATCFHLLNLFDLREFDAENAGKALVLLGSTASAIGAATWLLMPVHHTTGDNGPVRAESKGREESTRAELFFSGLLFLNALPGMTVFAAFFPLFSYFNREDNDGLMAFIPLSLLALGSGGVLAPSISAYLGARSTFIILLCLRGALLVLLSQFEHYALALCTLLTILFAHGTGFSILPALIKAQSASAGLFIRSYGKVLVAWGFAGIVGCTLGTFVLSAGAMSVTSLILGLSLASYGILLHFVPAFGGNLLSD